MDPFNQVIPTEIMVIIISFFLNIVSSVFGMGGGVLLIMVLSAFFPVEVVIPLYIIYQLVVNGFRAATTRESIDINTLRPFLKGAIPVFILGAIFYRPLPVPMVKAFIGASVLLMIWKPFRRFHLPVPNLKEEVWGAIAATVMIFTGVPGPLIAAYLIGKGLNKQNFISTKSAIDVGLRIVAIAIYFTHNSVQISSYIPMLCGMCVAGVFANKVGKKILESLDPGKMKVFYRYATSVLALKLVLAAPSIHDIAVAPVEKIVEHKLEQAAHAKELAKHQLTEENHYTLDGDSRSLIFIKQ